MFESLDLFEIVNIYALLIGLTYGAVAQKKQFCFSGSIKDWVLDKSTRRLASLLMSMISAIIISQTLAALYPIDYKATIYLQSNVNYISIILGGVLFGIGMMWADGCSSRHLVKFAQGDLHSLVTIITISIFAFITSKGLFSGLFSTIEKNTLLLTLTSWIPNISLPMLFILTVLIIALYKVMPRLNAIWKLWDGLAVGLLVGAAWFTTGVIGRSDFDAVTLEGLSFIYPSAKSLEYLMYYSGSVLSFGVTIVFGIIIGALLTSLTNKKYRFGCAMPEQSNKLANSLLGGALMGVGGILSLGCTIGQGLTGLSTLALASVVAVTSISLSAYITARWMAKKDRLVSCFLFEW